VILNKGAGDWVPLLEREARSFVREPAADPAAEDR
jgi:hypothetical protein